MENDNNLEHKSRVVYSCGHNGVDVIGNQLNVKTITREGKRAIDIMTVCDNCLVWYRKNNLIIDNAEQGNRWLGITVVKEIESDCGDC